MHNPNSPVIMFRNWLSKKLRVRPDPGEGWCHKCALNGGRTLVISATAIHDHAETHKEQTPKANVDIEMVQFPRMTE